MTKLDLSVIAGAVLAIIGVIVCFSEPPYGWRVPLYFACALALAFTAVYFLVRKSSRDETPSHGARRQAED